MRYRLWAALVETLRMEHPQALQPALRILDFAWRVRLPMQRFLPPLNCRCDHLRMLSGMMNNPFDYSTVRTMLGRTAVNRRSATTISRRRRSATLHVVQ